MEKRAQPIAPGQEFDRVLVVDDDGVARAMIADALEEAGFLPIFATNADEAMSLYRREQPRLVTLDLLLPGSADGLEICRQMRAIDTPYRTHIVMITSQSQRKRLVEALESGADDFIGKPFDATEVQARLKTGRRLLQMESRLVHDMLQDEMTGLLSRRAFNDMLPKEWSAWLRSGSPLSCVFIDVDFFKSINDVHGHDAGDAVLRKIAHLVGETTRHCDGLFRFGGEEFVALLPCTDEQGATIWAERARTIIEQHVFEFSGERVEITASFGVAAADSCMEKGDELIRAADQCLLAAKDRGRNRVINVQRLAERGAAGSAQQRDEALQLLESVPLSEAMSPLIHYLTPAMTLVQAADYLRSFRLSSAPVVDGDGSLLGLISEKDVLHIAHSCTTGSKPVSDIMRRSVVAFDEGISLLNVLGLMQRTPYRNIVVTRDGLPVGVVHRGSLLAWCAANLWQASESDEGEEPPVCTTVVGALATADEVVATAQRLRNELSASAGDPAPAVLAGSSRIQDLLHDLLSATPALQA